MRVRRRRTRFPRRPARAHASEGGRGAPVGVVLVDLLGRVQVASQSLRLLLGQGGPAELVGWRLFEGYQLAHQDGSILQPHELPWMVSGRTGQPQRGQLVRVSGTGGTDLLLRVSAEPLLAINATSPYAVMVRLEPLDPPPPPSISASLVQRWGGRAYHGAGGAHMTVSSSIDQIFERAVAHHAVPGIAAMAANTQGVIYQGAFGTRAVDGTAPMALDSVVWIASMTKAVTSVAAMQLVEQGRLELDAPLAEHVPELGKLQVLDGFDAGGAPRLRPARRAITLRHLLTHTAGFTYDIWNADMGRYQAHTDTPGIIECKNVSLQVPLVFDPGERWEYGINIDWVGKTVERLSGQSLEDYFRAHIFDPLRMPDTRFVLGPDQRARLASMHVRDADGALRTIAFEVPQQPEFFMGGGGLYSTAPDYLRFLRMLLGSGELDGARVLRPETVRLMGQNHIGELQVQQLKTAIPASSNDAEFFPGMVKKWGLAAMLCPEAAPTGRGAGSLAWAGLANTYYWLDPTRGVTGVLLTQILPFADATVLNLFEQFERAIYTS